MSSAPARALPVKLGGAAIRHALRAKVCLSDEDFDRVFPMTDRHRSSVHWTPIDVGLQVASLLTDVPGGRVLDVGSGVGKMCLIGALAGEAHWIGVERDRRMVRTAQRVARELGAERASFIHEDAIDVDWSSYGGVYLYNPFAEAAFRDIATEPLVAKASFIYQVLAAERQLATLPLGARVVTYFGFGGDMPSGFELAIRIPTRGDALEMWIRTGPVRA